MNRSVYVSFAQVAPGMLTLSHLPRSQWKSLINLETIKERNKPIMPPTKPAAAPFFLPTIADVSGETQFDLSGVGTVITTTLPA